MARIPVRRAALVTLLGLLTAGVAFGAYSLLGRRDVTTSSAEAYRLYKLGRENELKLYHKDALANYAEALAHDGHFVMATVRLAYLMRDRDPERAKALMDGIQPFVDSVSKREQLKIRIYETMWGEGDAEKRNKEIATLLDEYVRRYPDDPDGYFDRAGFYLKGNRPKEAMEEYEKVLRFNPNYAQTYNSLGYYSLAIGEYAKAEDYLKRYRFLAPDQANPYDSLGEFYAAVGRYDDAEESLKKALQVKPDFYPAEGHLGTVALGRGDVRAAAEHFRRAAEAADTPIARDEFEWRATLVLATGGLRDEALAQFERVPVPQPAGAADADEAKRAATRYEVEKGILLARIGKPDEAERILADLESRARELEGEDPQRKKYAERNLAVLRGLIADARGQHEEAARLLGEALPDRLPTGGFGYFLDELMIRSLIAKNLAAAGKKAEAEEALAPVLRLNPHFAPAVAVATAAKLEVPAPSEAGSPAAR
jgi:tetratricopeptide (TPR) repeat protein